MDTRNLRSFLKVADTGSITRAAVSLGIAQPSLSQQLLRLESELGFDLLRRTARGVTLTERGRVFQERARQILQNAEQAIEDGRRFGCEPTGDVILALPYSISTLAGLPLLEAFQRHALHVALRLVEASTGQIRGWLDEAKVDLGILHETGPLRHLSTRRLAVEELFLIGPAGQYGDLRTMPDVELSALAKLPMILPGHPHGLRQVIEHEVGRFGVDVDVRLELDAVRHIAALVAMRHGYSILPLPLVSDQLISGKISIARIGGGAIRRRLCLVRNSGQVVTHASVRCEDLTSKVLLQLIEKGLWRAEPDPELR